jgi:uncharacterized protein (DUF1015 family)
MATIKPFAALRPRPELAEKICELPYDVMSSDEARQMAAGNPLSFLHVSKPEIDLPPGTDACAPEVYAKGRENFQKLIRDGALRQDPQPCFYLYRQIMGGHAQTGLVAVADCGEYLRGVIKKNELTRPDKEDDRMRHIETLNSQTGPASLACRAARTVDEFIAKKTSEKPEVDFTARDGVRHSSWTIRDAKEMRFIETEFAKVPALYIADGHHRSAAAARIYLKRSSGRESAQTFADKSQSRLTSAATERDHSGRFLAVIFPHDRMQILPYNRVMRDLNGWTPEQLLEILSAVFAIDPNGAAVPGRNHEVGLYLGGKWRTLFFPRKLLATGNPVEQLDVTLLQKHVFEPVFGIKDPRTDRRIQFVGGIRGTAELEKLVNSGEAACAFSLFPVNIEDLMTIADAGGILPPKSTWFEPKLRDGMFCHLI